MEKEIKITIKTKSDFSKILTLLRTSNIKNQINTYYTSDYLKQNKIALRTREVGEIIELTTKERYSLEGGYFQSKEDTVNIEPSAGQSLLDCVKQNAKAEFIPSQIEILLQMKTTRHVQVVDGFQLELDEVHVVSPHDFIFWELECETETPDQYLEFIKKHFSELNVDVVFSEVVKMERALRGF